LTDVSFVTKSKIHRWLLLGFLERYYLLFLWWSDALSHRSVFLLLIRTCYAFGFFLILYRICDTFRLLFLFDILWLFFIFDAYWLLFILETIWFFFLFNRLSLTSLFFFFFYFDWRFLSPIKSKRLYFSTHGFWSYSFAILKLSKWSISFALIIKIFWQFINNRWRLMLLLHVLCFDRKLLYCLFLCWYWFSLLYF
jgi:hypothetical protein